MKEDESCIQPVAQTIGEIEFSEEMNLLEEMTGMKEFLVENEFQDNEDDVEEELARSLINFWGSSYQKKNVLTSDENFNIFGINELCISVGVTCDEPCEVFLEVKEEEGEYPCILDMDQSQKFVPGIKGRDDMALWR